MTELFREIDEALTYDRFMASWRRYRVLAICSLVVALGSVVGWQFWQRAHDKRLLEAGEKFFELLEKTRASTVADAKIAKNLLAKNLTDDETLIEGYAMLWSFKRAQIFTEQRQWSAANDVLARVTADKSLDKLYRNYARLWQATNLIKQNKLEDALQLLAPLTAASGGADDASLRALALYLKASIGLAQNGNALEAKKELEAALSLGKIAPELRAKIEQAQTALPDGS